MNYYSLGMNLRNSAVYLLIIHFLISIAVIAVNGQKCVDNVGSLDHNGIDVVVDRTFIFADQEYKIACNGTVIAWEFCYRVQQSRKLMTFYPSIWMPNETTDNGTIGYTLLRSSTVTFIPVRVGNNSNSDFSCQIFNLSKVDQFIAPEGSVVGLYSIMREDLLRTNKRVSSFTTYQFVGNQSNVEITVNTGYNIALRAHLDMRVLPATSISATSPTMMSSPTTSTSPAAATTTGSSSTTSTSNTITTSTPSTTNDDDDNFRIIWIIVGCVVGSLLCITHLLLIILLLWCRRRRRGKCSDSPEDAKSTTGCIINSTGISDDSNRYSTVIAGESQAYSLPVTRNNFSDYTIPMSTSIHKSKPQKVKKYRGVGSTSVAPAPLPIATPYLTPQNNSENEYSKFSNGDYEPIPSDYGSAMKVYSNSLTRTVVYDNAKVVQYSKVLHQNAAAAVAGDDDEEVYSDPGHSETDIYNYFKKKKFHIIKKDSVSISQQLGFGEFGVVSLGKWSKTSADSVQVAVKTLNSECSESEKVKFLREAAIMGQFEDIHIVKLHGVVTEFQNTMIILEYMPKGDLQELLVGLKQRASSEAELKHDLLSYCRQIAAGMNYLANKQFVHRDLAARNILVSSDDVCKIADFGMARDVSDDTYYIIAGGKIPIKWTAPEAIFYRKYSIQSDVWSYGCVMYEIWSLGHKPFEDDDGREYLNKISLGYRLPPPPGCSRAVYELMIQCWHPLANQRINSKEVLRTLGKSDRILLPSNEEQSTKLGDALSQGSELHLDLQQTYFLTS